MTFKIIATHLLILSVIFTEKISPTPLPPTLTEKDITRESKLIFDPRSLQQVSSRNTAIISDYRAVFDGDENTAVTFDSRSSQQISFQLLDTETDQNFATIFYSISDNQNTFANVIGDFTISVVDKNGTQKLCDVQSQDKSQKSGFIACKQNGIQLVFKHQRKVKPDYEYLFKEIAVWSNQNLKALQANDEQIFGKCFSIDCKYQRYLRNLATCPNSCTISSIRILLDATLTPLVAQSFDLTSVDQWELQLAVDQTTTCCDRPVKWTVTVTSVDNPASVTIFDNISGSGIIKTGKLNDYQAVGNYIISVTQVKIAGVWYLNEIMNTPQSPNFFNLSVLGPCNSATVTFPTISDVFLKVFDPLASYNTFQNFNYATLTNNKINTNPDCGSFTYSASITQTTAMNSISAFSLDQVFRNFQIQSLNLNQVGTYTVVLTGALTQYPSQFGQTSFKITVLNPCWQTVLAAATTLTTLFNYVLSATASLEQVPQVNNLIDSSQNKVLEICGGLSYSINDSFQVGLTSLTASELTVSTSGQISLRTDNFATVGSHTATLTTYLTSYPNVTISFTLPIIIQPCLVQSVNISQPMNQMYTIANPTKTWTVPSSSVTQTPACGYGVSLSVDLTSVPQFVTSTAGSSLQFHSFTRNKSFAHQSYRIKINANLLGYPYTAPQGGTIEQTLSIEDPCQFSKITGPSTIQDLVTFGGYNSTSISPYAFNDTVSEQLTLLTDSEDFCGTKSFLFQINATKTTLLEGSNMQKIVFSPKSNINTFGTQVVTLKITLQNYQSVQSVINFNVVTLGSIASVIPNHHYQVGQQTLHITYESFEIVPASYNSANITTHDFALYLLSNNTDISNASLQSSSLVLMSNQSWIHFNSSSNSIKIFTTNNDLVGNYTLAVVQTFNYFSNLRYFAQFQLTISKSYTVDLTPIKTKQTLLYVIGASNKPVSLIQYYNLSLSQEFLIFFNVTQISGVILQCDQYFVDENYNLIFKVENSTLANSKSEFQIKVTTNLIDQIQNNDLAITVLFQINQKQLSQIHLSQSDIQREQKSNFLFQYIKKPILQTSQQSQTSNLYPARITSISSQGLVTISFSKQLYLPQFQQQPSNRTNSQNERSLNNTYGMQLQEFINSYALEVKLKTNQGLRNIDWVCKSLTTQQLQIQLSFQRPLDISSYFTDRLQVKFLQPDIFVLNTLTDYLFTQDFQQTLAAQIPPQFPSEYNHAIFTSVAQSATNAAPVIIVITLLLQIIAKKVITSMFIYYSVLQIILYVSLQVCKQIQTCPPVLTFQQKLSTESSACPNQTNRQLVKSQSFLLVLISKAVYCISWGESH